MISYAFTVPVPPSLGLKRPRLLVPLGNGTAPDEAGSRPSIASALPCPRALRRGRVSTVNQMAAFGVGALRGSGGRARRGPAHALEPGAGQRRAELREKRAEAKRAEVDESDSVPPGWAQRRSSRRRRRSRPPRLRPRRGRPRRSGPPPADEFEAMRRRIHEEGKRCRRGNAERTRRVVGPAPKRAHDRDRRAPGARLPARRRERAAPRVDGRAHRVGAVERRSGRRGHPLPGRLRRPRPAGGARGRSRPLRAAAPARGRAQGDGVVATSSQILEETDGGRASRPLSRPSTPSGWRA